MPASERCPGQPSVALKFFTLTTQFDFGHGCDHPSYVPKKVSAQLPVRKGKNSLRQSCHQTG